MWCERERERAKRWDMRYRVIYTFVCTFSNVCRKQSEHDTDISSYLLSEYDILNSFYNQSFHALACTLVLLTLRQCDLRLQCVPFWASRTARHKLCFEFACTPNTHTHPTDDADDDDVTDI